MFLSLCQICVQSFKFKKQKFIIEPKFKFFQLIGVSHIRRNVQRRCLENEKIWNREHLHWLKKMNLGSLMNFCIFELETLLNIFDISSRTLCQNFRTIGIKVPEKSKILDPPFLNTSLHATYL
eukprot:sb/3475812/